MMIPSQLLFLHGGEDLVEGITDSGSVKNEYTQKGRRF